MHLFTVLFIFKLLSFGLLMFFRSKRKKKEVRAAHRRP